MYILIFNSFENNNGKSIILMKNNYFLKFKKIGEMNGMILL